MPDDEVGDIVFLLAVEGVGDREAQVLVLDVADDFVHVFKVWAIFCSQESVSATTWEMWHLSARVA